MPKYECSSVSGHSPRKALGGHAPRKALLVKKVTKKRVSKAEAKKDKAYAREVIGSDEHVSASPTPSSPTYDRESWWDSFFDLSNRIKDVSVAIQNLNIRVEELQQQYEKDRAGRSVLGK